MESERDAWFVREILVHEEALLRYLYRVWFERDEVRDLCQEVYVRVYEAAAKSFPATPKAFLFATARHLMTDQLRRRRVVSIEAMGDLHDSFVLRDETSPERRLDARQQLRRMARAFDRLPPRCREVVWLRRIEDLPQKRVAAELGISEKTVEKQLAKGMCLLADMYYGGLDAEAPPTESRRVGSWARRRHERE